MSRVKTYVLAARPWAFPASVIPALLGCAVAVTHGGVSLHWLHALIVAVVAACLQGAANLINDYYDFKSGVDRPGIDGASRGNLVTGILTPRQVLIEGLILWGVGALAAVYFVITVGPILLPLIAAGFVIGFGYTAAPSVWKYRALGELCVFAAFGVGLTLGSYVVQTGHYSWIPVAYSLPVAFLIAAILLGNNLRDIASDRDARIRTLAMQLGHRRGRFFYLSLLAAAYVFPVGMAATRAAVPSAMLPLASLPLALRTMRGVWPRIGQDEERAGLIDLDLRTAQLQMVFGLLLIFGTLVPVFF